MPIQKIPVTQRDFFWEDPFFENVWDEFDSIRNSIWKENQDMFSRFEKQAKSLSYEKSSSSSSAMKSSSEMKSSSALDSMKSSSALDSALDSSSALKKLDLDSDSFFSNSFPGHRRWLMPRDFFSDSDFGNFKIIPTLKDEVLKVTDNDEKFEVSKKRKKKRKSKKKEKNLFCNF